MFFLKARLFSSSLKDGFHPSPSYNAERGELSDTLHKDRRARRGNYFRTARTILVVALFRNSADSCTSPANFLTTTDPDLSATSNPAVPELATERFEDIVNTLNVNEFVDSMEYRCGGCCFGFVKIADEFGDRWLCFWCSGGWQLFQWIVVDLEFA